MGAQGHREPGRGRLREEDLLKVSIKSKRTSNGKICSTEGFPDRGIYKCKGLGVGTHLAGLRNSQKINTEGGGADGSHTRLKFGSQQPLQAAHKLL